MEKFVSTRARQNIYYARLVLTEDTTDQATAGIAMISQARVKKRHLPAALDDRQVLHPCPMSTIAWAR